MRRWSWAAAAACLCVLCLFVCPALVRHQNAPARQTETELPAAAELLMQRCTMPAESGGVLLAEKPVQERYAAMAAERQQLPLGEKRVCCDGNGWILTGETWPRTVYAVCPPEGVPG